MSGDNLHAEIAALREALERFEHRQLARFERRMLIRLGAIIIVCAVALFLALQIWPPGP
jgi:hypothetical protein